MIVYVNRQIVIDPDNVILLSNKKEQITVTFNNKVRSLKHAKSNW